MSRQETSLYEIVLSAILSGKFDDKPLSDLIEEVEKDYVKGLASLGMSWSNSGREGLKTEIHDSVKAITYGFYSIKEYNSHRKS